MIGIAVFVGAYSIGAAVPLSASEAADVKKQFSDQIQGVDQNGIFFNNVKIALAEFIPAAGAVIAVTSGYATGAVFSALARDTPSLAGIPPVVILLTPFGALEIFAYGLALSRSGLLVYRLAKDRPWRKGQAKLFVYDSLVPTAIEVAIVVAVLFAGAVIEWQFIQQFGGINAASGLR